MTTYNWKVTSGNFGAASSWNPAITPTSGDGTVIGISTSLFGAGSALWFNLQNAITVTISSALTTYVTDDVLAGATAGTTVIDVDATWTNPDCYINIGQNGFGAATLYVNAGGSLNSQGVGVGTNFSNLATNYSGTLVVQNGGKVTTTGGGDDVGVAQGGTGALTVTGSGSNWTSDDYLNIGNNGTGVLTVENGATLNAGRLTVGVNYQNNSVASGTGTAYILSGAVVTTTGGYQEIGNDATGQSGDVIEGATGAVTVDGAGTKWNVNGGAVEIGDAGSKSGSLTISNHANVTATNEFDIGNEYNGADGSYGTLLIESGGTAVTGGYVNSDGSYDTLGSNNAGAPTSTATVTGSGSSWEISATLTVNKSGKAQAAAGGAIDAQYIGIFGGSIQVDANSTIEDGTTGGAALGYLTVDPVAPSANSNLYGYGVIDGNVDDNGKIYVQDGGPMVINGATGGVGAVVGSGLLLIGTQATLDLNATVASTLTARFRGWDGTLEISDPAQFSAQIDNFKSGDAIDLQGLTYNAGASSYVFTPSGANGAGSLVVTEGGTKITLNISSSPQALAGNLTLSKDAGTGTDITFTSGATSPFNLWSTVGSFFNTTAGPVNGEDYATSNVTDGGTPIWVETEAPAASYVAGGANTYSIVLETQDWLADVQPEITVATLSNFVDPFGSPSAAPLGNLATPVIVSNTSSQGTGGVVYWAASATTGDYALDFQPITVSYPSAPATANLVTLGGSPTTMISAIASPLTWQISSNNSSSIVAAYATAATSTTENVYYEGFNASGAPTNAGPVLVAGGVARGTQFYIGYNSSGYGYRYLEVGGALGTGLVGGTFNTTTGAVGTASLFLALPAFSSFSGVDSYSISNGNTVRLVEGVSNGQAVLETFLNGSSTPQATFQLASSSDYFESTRVYDVNDAQMDYIALAYVDSGKVHLELLNENGQQIGADLIVPGLSSFLRIHTMNASTNPPSTRVELDYEVANSNGGQLIEGVIYDTTPFYTDTTLSGGGLRDGTPFDDSFVWGAGVYTIDGGGGTDTFVATNLASASTSVTEDAAGEVIVNDGQGDVDTLRRFSVVQLSDATVTISGNTLTETYTSGGKTVSTYGGAGELLSVKTYNAQNALTAQTYTTQIPDDFTGDARSSVLFEATNGTGALATWKLNDATFAGGAFYGSPGATWVYQGAADFYGDGYSAMLWQNTSGQLATWRLHGATNSGGGFIGSPGGTWQVVAEGDFNGDGYGDILFENAAGALAVWDMNGSTILGGGGVGTIPAGYSLIGTGDFNGDGKTDLLFESANGNYVIWNINGVAISGATTLIGPGLGWVVQGVGNFNGLGDSDILFENVNTGQYATWDIANDVKTGGGVINSLPGPNWKVAEIANTTAGGRSSVILENTTNGQLYSWDLNDYTLSGGGPIGSPGAGYTVFGGPPAASAEPTSTIVFVKSGVYWEWDVSGTTIENSGQLGSAAGYTALSVGDFNGDGQADILFTNGASYALWETNGSAIAGGGAISGASASGLTYRGVGDFNGDGRTDILFQNASGAYQVWDMNGATVQGVASLGSLATGLTFAGVADLNDDGNADLVTTDASGNYWVSYVNVNSITGTTEIGNPGAGYTLVGFLKVDGAEDMVFSHAGVLTGWEVNQGTLVNSGTIGAVPTGFSVVGVADFGNAGHPSLVFDNATTGQVTTWVMNGLTVAGGGTVGTAAGFSILGVA
jgi:T5SS/PEP-CTERM-associated repeat protein